MFGRKREPGDFRSEIAAHIQVEAERLREQGLSEEDAGAAARRSFGNVMQTEERFHEAKRWLSWDQLWQAIPNVNVQRDRGGVAPAAVVQQCGSVGERGFHVGE